MLCDIIIVMEEQHDDRAKRAERRTRERQRQQERGVSDGNFQYTTAAEADNDDEVYSQARSYRGSTSTNRSRKFSMDAVGLKMQSQSVHHTSSGMSFGPREETMLRIRLIGTNDPAEVFPAPVVGTVPDYLKHLELENFGIAEILTFAPQDHRELSKSQRLFLRRVQDVTVNALDPANRLDLYVQDLADCVIKECKLDDGGIHLYGRFSNLALRIGAERYTMLSDREGRRRSGELTWIVQHSKHRLDRRYKQGDIQLVASLLAACQENFARNQGVHDVKVLYGIKVVGEEFFLFSVNFREEYLRQIAEKPPTVDLVAHKFPLTSGLRISKQGERKKLLCLLHTIRECCIANVHF